METKEKQFLPPDKPGATTFPSSGEHNKLAEKYRNLKRKFKVLRDVLFSHSIP